MQKLYLEAESFIKDVFWSESHDKSNNLNIVETVHQKLIKDNEEKDPDYYNHRPGVVHVTSLTKCLRGVVIQMLGAEKDEKMDARKLGVFKAGNLFEDFIVDALGDKMLDRQTEYVYAYKGVILTGRDDGTILHEEKRRVLENKSVHSDSFWYREKEGTLVAVHNQQQLQTYLWLRRILPNMFTVHGTSEIIYTNLDKQALWEYRGSKADDFLVPAEKPNNDELGGIFCYISKDDCTIAQAPVKFNQRIIDDVVVPALDIIAEGYASKNLEAVPLPPLVRYEDSKNTHQVNWVCKYCEYHNQCAGAGWLIEAQAEAKRKNTELSTAMVNKFAIKPAKPIIGVDTGAAGGDKTVMVAGHQQENGKIEITSIEIKDVPPIQPPAPATPAPVQEAPKSSLEAIMRATPK